MAICFRAACSEIGLRLLDRNSHQVTQFSRSTVGGRSAALAENRLGFSGAGDSQPPGGSATSTDDAKSFTCSLVCSLVSSLYLASGAKLDLASGAKLELVCAPNLADSPNLASGAKLASFSILEISSGTESVYSFPPVNPFFFLVSQPFAARAVVIFDTLGISLTKARLAKLSRLGQTVFVFLPRNEYSASRTRRSGSESRASVRTSIGAIRYDMANLSPPAALLGARFQVLTGLEIARHRPKMNGCLQLQRR